MPLHRTWSAFCDCCDQPAVVRIDDWTVSFRICLDCEIEHDLTQALHVRLLKKK